jgi:ABC-type antimicrobial peptide transport system permease subunit
MILKSLLRRKTRTLLTVLGVSIGVAAIVALGALADGFSEGYSALGGGSGADLLVMQSDAVDVAFSAVDEQVGETLVGLSGVKEVDSMIYTFAATEMMPYFIVYGYSPDGFAIDHFKIVEGEPLSASPSTRGGNPLILGKMAAEDLETGVGDTLKLYETTFRIVGIYETGKPFEDGAAVLLLEDAQVLSKHPHQANAFLLKLRDGEDAEGMRDRIERRFPDLTATLSADFTDSQEMLSMVTGFTWAVSFLAVVIGGVGVMNTVLMSIFERTREFGTLRAVGWRPIRVLGLVLGESAVLCSLGGVVGAALGVGVVEAVKRAPLAGSLFPSISLPRGLAQRSLSDWWAGCIHPGGRPGCCRRRPCDMMAAAAHTPPGSRSAERRYAISFASPRARCSPWPASVLPLWLWSAWVGCPRVWWRA